MGKVFELRYCTSIVTERKMRFSLRLNFVLLTALLEDDGRGIIMASPSILIHRWAAARSLNNIANIFFKASVVVYIGELPANPQGNSVSPFFNSRFPFLVQVSSWFECRATVSPSLCSLLHMHNRQVLRIGDKKLKCLQGIARVYTPGDDLSVMPFSTSSIRSSSMTTGKKKTDSWCQELRRSSMRVQCALKLRNKIRHTTNAFKCVKMHIKCEKYHLTRSFVIRVAWNSLLFSQHIEETGDSLTFL